MMDGMSTPHPLQESPPVTYARHVRRSAIVDTVEQAFAFCLTAIDEEQIGAPVMSVEPVMTYDHADQEDLTEVPEGRIRYEVTIAGHSG